MANAHKGEVSFQCDGKNYTLRFSANALCELEDALDLGISAVAQLLSDPEKLRFKTVRAVFWAGLLDRQPGMTLQQAGELVTTLTLPIVLEKIGEAFTAAFPAPEASVPTRPQKPEPDMTPAPAGTGTISSENGAKPVSTTKPFGAAPQTTSSHDSRHAKLS